jgi:hypothetical protein
MQTAEEPLQPSQFKVNEAWLLHQATTAPMSVQRQKYHVYALQDAASMYLFGQLLVPENSLFSDSAQLERVLRTAWGKKQEWPSKLLLPDDLPFRELTSTVAAKLGITIQSVSASRTALYGADLQASFAEFFGRGT